MATQGLITEFIDRTGIEADKDFMLKALNELLNAVNKVKENKIGLQGASTFKEAATETDKLRQAQDELSKVQQKLKDIQTEAGRQLLEYKDKLRQATNEQKNAIREQNASVGSIEQMRAALIRLNKEYDNLAQAERDSAKGQELKTKIKGLSDSLKGLEGETGRFQRNVGNYSGAVKILEKSLQEVKGKLDELTASGNTNTATFETLQKEFGVLNNVVNSQAHGFVSMREEIKSNQAAIEQLSLVYGEDSEIVRSLILENGKLRDSFSDLKATQKAVGSDTFAFDALLQGAQTHW
jgi:chromosome segregation ATPase